MVTDKNLLVDTNRNEGLFDTITNEFLESKYELREFQIFLCKGIEQYFISFTLLILV